MFKKQTISKKIEGFIESAFWISYFLFMVLTLVASLGIFIYGIIAGFAA